MQVSLTHTGGLEATEVAQLYIRDLVGNVTRPVRELKGFQRVTLSPGETRTVTFTLHTDDLGFYGRDDRWRVEPGEFELWVGGDSEATLGTRFRLLPERVPA